MTAVGPKEGPEPQDAKKSKKSVDSDAFKEMMRVGKVREVDPEEQRKRKARPEIEAESAAMAEGMMLAPPTPQALPSETEETFKIDTSNLAEGTPSTGAAATPEEYSEEEVGAGPTYTQATPPSLPPEGYLPEMGQGPGITPSEKEKQSAEEVKEPEKPAKKKAAKKAAAAGPPIKKAKIVKLPVAKPAAEAKKETAFPEKREVFPEKLIPTPKETEEMAETAETPIIPLAQGSWERVKEESEEKKGIEATGAIIQPPSGIELGPLGLEVPVPITPSLAAPFARFPQMWELFDRMVGVMTVMTDSGISETTINLTADQFKASPFYGTQIIIREFSTAPKAFNIELAVPTQGRKLMEANFNELVAAFQAGNYNFKVNRLEWRELPARKEEEKRGRVTRVRKTKEEK